LHQIVKTYIGQVLLRLLDAESLLVLGRELAEQGWPHLLQLLRNLLLAQVLVQHLSYALLVKAYDSKVVHQSVALLQLVVKLLLLPLLLFILSLLAFPLYVRRRAFFFVDVLGLVRAMSVFILLIRLQMRLCPSSLVSPLLLSLPIRSRSRVEGKVNFLLLSVLLGSGEHLSIFNLVRLVVEG
jgi:hypothetical protein